MEHFQNLSWWLDLAAKISAILAAGAVILALICDKTKKSLSLKFVWIAAVFAVVAAGLPFIQDAVDNQITELVAERKRTLPVVDVELEPSDGTALYVKIASKNNVPLESNWIICTRNNVIVCGMRFTWTPFYPSRENDSLKIKDPLSGDPIQDNYIELRFRYRSVYSAELNLQSPSPIIRKYRISNDRKSLTPLRE